MAKHLVFNPSHGSSSVLPRGESDGQGSGGHEERGGHRRQRVRSPPAGPSPVPLALHSGRRVLP